jgi:hypothetical protein
MRKRAETALHRAGYFRQWQHDNGTPPALIAALVDYAAQNPGLDPRDYGYDPADFGRYSDPHWREAYQGDSRTITRQWHDVKAALRECYLLDVTNEDILAAAPQAFSGRLEITPDGKISYTPGQYPPTEYRAAVAAVLRRAAWIVQNRNKEA